MSKNDSHLASKLAMLAMATFVLCVLTFLVKDQSPEFDPIAWLTLIIGGAFGLAVTIIISARSDTLLHFLHNAEQERRKLALRTIRKNLQNIQELCTLYLDTINSGSIPTKQKRDALRTFLPRFGGLLSICQGTTPIIGDFISQEDLTKLEQLFILLSDLFTILEFGTDIQFESNIQNLQQYCDNAINFLDKVSHQ